MARKRKKGESAGIGYMLTYGDMITLILCFFIAILALTNMERPATSLILSSLRGSLGTLGGGSSVTEPDMLNMGVQVSSLPKGIPGFATGREEKEGRRRVPVRAKIQQMFGKILKRGGVNIRSEERGIIVQIADSTLFDPSSTELKPQSQEVLIKIGELLALIPNEIKIEGHTDDIMVDTGKYASNWELSTMRALSVLRFIESKFKGVSDKLSATGYGMYRPLVPNTSPENRVINRRVDIVIVQEPVDINDQEIKNLD
ncbi:flagellar motor protein MotB [bacterium]|nr:flagellar motor protein MotB [bacterium]MBU1153930.1 flagellar motor protein MotB [bacterium]MBU1782788.1 flagellar motor protein MotB [bacterium]MBU2599771.1 flagellar motor protein MotB [bacterium]